MTKATDVEDKMGVLQKVGQPMYAWWVPASANMLSLAGRGSVSGVFVSWS